MKHGLLLIAFLIAVTALTSGEYSSIYQSAKPAPTTTTLKTTSQPPNTTTHAPNTTTHAPNTTTHAPNTTTHAPNTTTHAPNTTTHAPNTTTQAPNTTTHAPNTTTQAPTPPPSPTPPTTLKVGYYNVSKDGKFCILANFAVTLRVNNSEVNGTYIFQPDITIASGECGEETATLMISENQTNAQITLKFKLDKNAQKVYVEYLSFDVTYAFKTGASVEYSETNSSLMLFAAAVGHSYSCRSESVYMGNGTSLDFSTNRVQAVSINNNQFGATDLCKADVPDYRVPIAVGIILIILIIIVVIAYLISRKRRTDGYQSL